MEIRQDVDLRPYNSFAVPAMAAHFVELTQADELPAVFQHAQQHNLPLLLLGGGSNTLFVNDFAGLVVHIANRGVTVEEDSARVRVAAGENWHELVEFCMNKGFHGLENLALIPGSAGAAPVQNIGAYGVELSQVLESVKVFDTSRQAFRRLSADECEFEYRSSLFKQPAGAGLVITELVLQLDRQWRPQLGYEALRQALSNAGIDTPSPQQVFDTVCQVRQSKLPDPSRLGNGGSFFKNPVISLEKFERLRGDYPELPRYAVDEPDLVKIPAAWLLDRLGWKGRSRGAAAVHEDHALVLVNKTNATGEDIYLLAQEMSSNVLTQFGIALQPEVRII